MFNWCCKAYIEDTVAIYTFRNVSAKATSKCVAVFGESSA
jgi:hypothetical protein